MGIEGAQPLETIAASPPASGGRKAEPLRLDWQHTISMAKGDEAWAASRALDAAADKAAPAKLEIAFVAIDAHSGGILGQAAYDLAPLIRSDHERVVQTLQLFDQRHNVGTITVSVKALDAIRHVQREPDYGALGPHGAATRKQKVSVTVPSLHMPGEPIPVVFEGQTYDVTCEQQVPGRASRWSSTCPSPPPPPGATGGTTAGATGGTMGLQGGDRRRATEGTTGAAADSPTSPSGRPRGRWGGDAARSWRPRRRTAGASTTPSARRASSKVAGRQVGNLSRRPSVPTPVILRPAVPVAEGAARPAGQAARTTVTTIGRGEGATVTTADRGASRPRWRRRCRRPPWSGRAAGRRQPRRRLLCRHARLPARHVAHRGGARVIVAFERLQAQAQIASHHTQRQRLEKELVREREASAALQRDASAQGRAGGGAAARRAGRGGRRGVGAAGRLADLADGKRGGDAAQRGYTEQLRKRLGAMQAAKEEEARSLNQKLKEAHDATAMEAKERQRAQHETVDVLRRLSESQAALDQERRHSQAVGAERERLSTQLAEAHFSVQELNIMLESEQHLRYQLEEQYGIEWPKGRPAQGNLNTSVGETHVGASLGRGGLMGPLSAAPIARAWRVPCRRAARWRTAERRRPRPNSRTTSRAPSRGASRPGSQPQSPGGSKLPAASRRARWRARWRRDGGAMAGAMVARPRELRRSSDAPPGSGGQQVSRRWVDRKDGSGAGLSPAAAPSEAPPARDEDGARDEPSSEATKLAALPKLRAQGRAAQRATTAGSGASGYAAQRATMASSGASGYAAQRATTASSGASGYAAQRATTASSGASGTRHNEPRRPAAARLAMRLSERAAQRRRLQTQLAEGATGRGRSSGRAPGLVGGSTSGGSATPFGQGNNPPPSVAGATRVAQAASSAAERPPPGSPLGRSSATADDMAGAPPPPSRCSSSSSCAQPATSSYAAHRAVTSSASSGRGGGYAAHRASASSGDGAGGGGGGGGYAAHRATASSGGGYAAHRATASSSGDPSLARAYTSAVERRDQEERFSSPSAQRRPGY